MEKYATSGAVARRRIASGARCPRSRRTRAGSPATRSRWARNASSCAASRSRSCGTLAEHQDRVVPALLPEVAIEPPEQADRLVVPRPAEVVGQLLERPEPLGKRGSHVEALDGSHGECLRSRWLRRSSAKRGSARGNDTTAGSGRARGTKRIRGRRWRRRARWARSAPWPSRSGRAPRTSSRPPAWRDTATPVLRSRAS